MSLAALSLVACEPEPIGGGGRNHLGTGGLLAGAARENRWLGVSGPCSSAEQGDLVLAVSGANFTTLANPPSSPNSWAACTGGATEANPDHDPGGYVYGVRVPKGYDAGPLDVQVFDGAYCGQSSAAGDTSGAFSTTFLVRAPVAAGADPRAGEVLAEVVLAPDASCETWHTLHTIDSPTPGRTYHVQVFSAPASGQKQQGSNHFGLRARTGGTFVACSADPAAPDHDPDCVDLHAVGWVGWALTMSGTSSFPVARVRSDHAGQVLQISAWDPGEGSSGIRVVDPSGQRVPFEWEVVDRSGADVAPAGGWSGSVAAGGMLDVSGSGPQPGPRRVSSSRYNDRLLILRVAVPEDGSGTGTWKVSVVVGQSAMDRTTWRADVVPAGPTTTTTSESESTTTTHQPASTTTTWSG